MTSDDRPSEGTQGASEAPAAAERAWIVYVQVDQTGPERLGFRDDNGDVVGLDGRPMGLRGHDEESDEEEGGFLAEHRKREMRWWSVESRPPLPYQLKVRVGLTPGGRLVCLGLRVESDSPISARDLRKIKLPEILNAAARSAAMDDPEFSSALLGYQPQGALLRPRAHPGRRGYSREHFEEQELARIYADALRRDPRRPARYVAGALYITEHTARRWIKRAQALGVIPAESEEKP